MEPRADQTAEILERLRTGAAGHACAGFLTTLDPLHLADLLTGLVYDRLRRKYDAAAEIYRISGQNWNQTFYTLLFRYIGDLSNQDTYTELARQCYLYDGASGKTFAASDRSPAVRHLGTARHLSPGRLHPSPAR